MKLTGPTYKRASQCSSLAAAVSIAAAVSTEKAPENNVFDLLADLAGKVENPVVMFFDLNANPSPYRYRVFAVEKDGSSAANTKIAAFSTAINIASPKVTFTANNTDGAERASDTWTVAVTGSDALVKVAARTAEPYKLGVSANTAGLSVSAPTVNGLAPVDTDEDSVPDTSAWEVASNGSIQGSATVDAEETIERPFTPWGLLKAIANRVAAVDADASVFARFTQETGVLEVTVASGSAANTRSTNLQAVTVDNTVNMVAFEIDPAVEAAAGTSVLRWG